MNNQKLKMRSNSLFNTQINVKKEKLKEKNNKKEKENDKIMEEIDQEEAKKIIKNILSINLSEFKETIHKEYLQFQNRINESVLSYSENLKNVSTCEKRLIEQFANIKIKTEKIEMFSDKLAKIDDRLTLYEIRYNNLLRDYKASVDKYDSLFLDNMSVPGKIGKYCKYKNIKEFLSYTYDKFNEYDLKQESDNAKIKYEKENIQKFMKKINFEIDILREEFVQITSKKMVNFEKKLTDENNEIKKKLEEIPNIILYSDIEKRINDLIGFYNEIKNFKNDIYDKINRIENKLDSIKGLKNGRNTFFNDKKDIKVSFSIKDKNLKSSIKKTDIDTKNIDDTNYSKMIKYHSVNINKTPITKDDNNNIKNFIKNKQSLNLQNINEEYYENKENDNNNDNSDDIDNNDYSPINNTVIKSVNFSSYRFKTRDNNPINEDFNIYEKKYSSKTVCYENKNSGELYSPHPHILDDSSEDEVKREKIEEEIMVQNYKNEEKKLKSYKYLQRNSSIGENIELFILNSRKKIEKNLNKKNNIKKHINSPKNKGRRKSHTFPKYRNSPHSKNKNKKIIHNNKFEVKQDNFFTNEKDKKLFDKKTKIKKTKTIHISKLKAIELIDEDKTSKNNKNNINIINNMINLNNTNNVNNMNNMNNINNMKNMNNINNNNINNINNIDNMNNNNNMNNNINKTIENSKIKTDVIPNNSIFTIKNNIIDNKIKNINNNKSNNICNIINKSNNNMNIFENKKQININNIENDIKNNNIEKDNKKSNNIEIFNNNSIKNYRSKPLNDNNKKSLNKNKSSEFPKINNNSTSISITVGNTSDISFKNNINFSNNKDIGNKSSSGYYNLFKSEYIKKQEYIKNNKIMPLNPKEIPIITNSSFQSHSHSKKKFINKKYLFLHKEKFKLNGKNKEKNINLELKIIPANFKESKKIQVNMSDEE